MNCPVCQVELTDDSRFCHKCGADISTPSGGPAARTQVESLQALLEQVTAGRYAIRALLGRGGMGAVFLADDLRLERAVAIKVLPPDLSLVERFVQRFEREARTAAKLDHPHIVPIYAVESEAQLHYFVMKYIEGRSLDVLLESGPVPVRQAQRILCESCDALGHAHRKGVVHRDVKPSNIIIDAGGRVLLADFGISKALEGATQFTGTGQIVGTPFYMSPEQAKGQEVDGRSDQYALAVVGYQLLAGALPFASASPQTAIYQHIYETPRPLSEVAPLVPAFLTAVLQRAMAKVAADRFATMEEFAAALWPEREGALPVARGSTTLAMRTSDATPPTPSAPPRAARRLRPRTAVAGAALLVAAAAISLATWNRGPSDAVLPGASGAVPAGPLPPIAPAPRAADSAAGHVANPTAGAPAGTTRLPRPERSAPSRPVQEAVPVTAASVTGFIVVDATPFGTLSVNGVDAGDTPQRQALAPGTYTVAVRRDGYRPWTETITITAGNTERRRVQLVPQP